MEINFSGVIRRAVLAAAAVLAVAAGPAAADPLTPTETSIVASPNPALVNTTVTYSVEVISAPPNGGMGQSPPVPTGTVTLEVANVAIPGCVALPLVNGAATCQAPAGSTVAHRRVDADYSGDMVHAVSNGFDNLWVIAPATVTPSVTPNPVMRLAPITYKATVSGISLGGAIVPAMADFGTMAYYVDGELVAGCTAQPVDHYLKSSCPSLAPLVGGTHELKAVYSGSHYAGPNFATTDFVVLAPAATLPETVDFASVTVGSAATRTITLTNSGTADLHVGHALIKGEGPFAVTADGCVEQTLAVGATCDVVVTFTPGAVGTFNGKFGISHDAVSASGVALTGTGAAVPAPPTPTPPVVDPPKQPGGTLAPGAKPTLTVSIPSSGSNANASSVPVLSLPLSCPANEECLLNGNLKINTSTLSKAARAAATESQTVARFSKVQVEAGGLKTIKLKLSPKFVKSAQKRGIRKIKATLTINTVLGSGQRTTSQQQVTIVLPKAAKKKKAAQKVRPRFTG
jgi:hypothetical protein